MKKTILTILKGLALACLGFGALGVLGSVGANEQDNISLLQMLVQVVISVGVIASGVGIGVLREYLKSRFGFETVENEE